MSKYTPGPWTANGDQVEVETEKNDGYRVCDVFGPDYKANANLIAAAPELLDELKSIILESDKLSEAEFQAAASAIAKAEGRQ